MKLSVMERVTLLNILPNQGNFTGLQLFRKVAEALSFTEEEHRALNFRQEGQQLLWDDNDIPEKEIEIGDFVSESIASKLKAMDKEEKLAPEHISLYEKFVT